MVEQDFKVPSGAYVVDKLWAWVDSGLSGKSKQLASFLGRKAKVDFVRVNETDINHSENKTYLRISKFHDRFVEKKVIPVDEVTGVLADGIDSVIITTKGKDHRIVLVYEYNNIYSSDANSEKSATNIITNQLSKAISKAKKNSVYTYNPIEFISFEYEDENLDTIVGTVATQSVVDSKKLHDICLYGFDIWDTCKLDVPFNVVEKTIALNTTNAQGDSFDKDLYGEDYNIRNLVFDVRNDNGSPTNKGQIAVFSNKVLRNSDYRNTFPFVDGVWDIQINSNTYRSSSNAMRDTNLELVQNNFVDSEGNFGSNTTYDKVHSHGDSSTAPYFSYDYYTNQNLKGTNKYTGSWSPAHTSVFTDSSGVKISALHNTSLGLDKSVRFSWIDADTGESVFVPDAMKPNDNMSKNLTGHYMLCKEDGVYKVRVSLSHIAQAFLRHKKDDGSVEYIAGQVAANTPEQDFNMYVACNTYSVPVHNFSIPSVTYDTTGASNTSEGYAVDVLGLSEKVENILSNHGADKEDYVFLTGYGVTANTKILVHRNIMGPFKAAPSTGTISGYAEFIIPAKKNQTYFELDFVFQNNTKTNNVDAETGFLIDDPDGIGGVAKIVINADKLKNNSDSTVFDGIWNRYRPVDLNANNEFSSNTVETDDMGPISGIYHPINDWIFQPNDGLVGYDTVNFETTLDEINPGAAFNLSYMSIEKISDLKLFDTAVLSDNVETVKGVVPLKGVERIIETEEVEETASAYYYSGDGIGTGNL